MTQATPQKRFPQTRTARLARERLARMLQKLDHDEGRWWRVQELVPEAWATLEEDVWCEEPKVRLTLMLDDSVAKFYRAMGKGYQARMNRVLATYAQMKIGEVEREKASMHAVAHDPFPEKSAEIREKWAAIRDMVPDDWEAEKEFFERWFGG